MASKDPGVRLLVAGAACVLLAGATTVARPEPAAACSCATDLEPEASFGRAQAAFAGQLLDISDPAVPDDSGATVRLRFTVDRVYKGTVGREVVVATAASSASCGLGIESLGSYVIFASGVGTRFSATLCDGFVTGTPPAFLGAGAVPTAQVAPTTPQRGPTAAVVVGFGVVGAAALGRWRGRGRGERGGRGAQR